MNVESLYSAWKGNQSCGDCSVRLNVFRKKKFCFFCKNPFCQACIIRRDDKKLCCRKCQILTARPLDRNKLLNLRSRDLVNYLTARHIPTNGCVEKEDLVNVLMKAVNNSCFHPSSSTRVDCSSSTNSYPNSPRSNSFSTGQPNAKRKISQSVDNLYSEDGIRITGHNSVDYDTNRGHSSTSEQRTTNEYENSSDSPEVQYDRNNTDSQGNNDEADLGNNPPSPPQVNSDNFMFSQGGEGLPYNKRLMLSDIKSKADLDALSIKQLKELLMLNRTDFKGCIERAELVQKASILWSDYTDSRKDLENLTTDELCKICMDAPIECVLLECGHMATCTSCGKQLCECPICRQFVVRCVRTFKA